MLVGLVRGVIISIRPSLAFEVQSFGMLQKYKYNHGFLQFVIISQLKSQESFYPQDSTTPDL